MVMILLEFLTFIILVFKRRSGRDLDTLDKTRMVK